MNRLRFIFDLLDRASGPAKNIGGALGAVMNRVRLTATNWGLLDGRVRNADGAFRRSGAVMNALRGIVGGLRERVQGLAGSYRDADGRLRNADGSFRKAFSIGGFGGFNVGLDAMLSNVGRLIGLLGTLMSVMSSVGTEGVKALSFKESTLSSLEVMLGSKDSANRVFKQSLGFAKATPFETKEVVQAYKQALGAGFSEGELPVLLQGVGDVASASGLGQEAVGRLITAFAQMKGNGRFMTEELNQVMEVAGLAGVSRQAIFEKIAKNKGGGLKSTGVADAISAGQVDAQTGIYSILEAIKERFGGELGNQILKQSETIEGKLSTLQSAFGDFWLSMDFEDLPGLGRLKGAIQVVLDMLDTATPRGLRIQKVLEGVFNGVTEAIFGPIVDGKEQLESVLDAVLSAVEGIDWVEKVTEAKAAFSRLWDTLSSFDWRGAFSAAWDVFQGIVTALKAVKAVAEVVAGVFNFLGTAIGTFLGMMWGAVDGLADHFIDTFARLSEGFSALMEGRFADAAGAIWEGLGKATVIGDDNLAARGDGMGMALLSGFKDALQIRSPSRVFEEMGHHVTDGLVRGLGAGTAGVKSSMAGVGSAGAGAAASSLGVSRGATPGGAGRRVVQLGKGAVQININGASMDLEELAQRVAELLPSGLADAFELLDAEMGGE